MFRWYPADRLFYYPTAKTYEPPESSGLAVESVYFRTADRVRLHGLFFPAVESPRGTILHFHGNAGNVTAHWPFVAWLPPAGWNVLCFDYRGFGRSHGRISQRGSVLDGHAALDYVLSRPDVDPARVAAFGQSLGGAVAVVVGAERTELRAFLLEAAFSGYRSIARWHLARHPLLLALAWWVPPLLIDRRFDAVEHIHRIAPRPVLILHGMDDRTVPWQMAVKLHQAAGDPKELWTLPGLGHLESIEELPSGALTRISRFFERALSTVSVPSTTHTRDQS
jgi:fermentation-respiration switch protein FrsA (DUF1100 family)